MFVCFCFFVLFCLFFHCKYIICLFFLLIIIIIFIIIQYLFPTVATEEKKRKRFKVADADKDGLLNTDEVTSMFHPEERPHMFEVIIDVRFFFFPFRLCFSPCLARTRHVQQLVKKICASSQPMGCKLKTRQARLGHLRFPAGNRW